jgi:hypothetical protein
MSSAALDLPVRCHHRSENIVNTQNSARLPKICRFDVWNLKVYKSHEGSQIAVYFLTFESCSFERCRSFKSVSYADRSPYGFGFSDSTYIR